MGNENLLRASYSFFIFPSLRCTPISSFSCARQGWFLIRLVGAIEFFTFNKLADDIFVKFKAGWLRTSTNEQFTKFSTLSNSEKTEDLIVQSTVFIRYFILEVLVPVCSDLMCTWRKVFIASYPINR